MHTYYTKLRFAIRGVFVIIFLLILAHTVTQVILTYVPDIVVCNKGIAFGIRLPSLVLFGLWALVLAAVAALYFRTRRASFSVQVPFLLMLAGGLSNMLDRVAWGCVVDYVHIVPWNVFNLADVFIFCGVVMVLWRTYIRES